MMPPSPQFLNWVSDAVVPRAMSFSDEYLGRTLSEDRPLLERIVAAYHHAIASASRGVRLSLAGSIWTETGYGGAQGTLLDALESRTIGKVHSILSSLFISDGAKALAMGREEAELFRIDADHRRCYGLQWIDRLVSLAFAVGALPLPYPENNPDACAHCLEVDPEKVIAAIEPELGTQLEFPNICGVFGGELAGTPFPVHAFTLAAAAYQIKLLVDRPDPTILEIGGGFGGLAYWVTRMLPCRYLIYDLPLIGAIQAYFLARALPGRSLVLYGEGYSDAAIEIRPDWELLEQSGDALASLAVSQDSLVEIPGPVATAYLCSMKRRLAGPLLSINHESPVRDSRGGDYSSVRDLVKSAGGYRCRSRSPFLLRAGFVQEVFEPVPNPGRRT